MNNQLPILYKRNNNKAIMFWQIVVQDDTYFTIYGLLNGKRITTLPTQCKEKNIGKKNYINSFEQAIKEATSIWLKKQKSENFSPDLDFVMKNEKNIIFNPPMLAKKYDLIYNEKYEFVQPKLDGIRCNCHFNNGNIDAISRKNTPFKYITHITEALRPILEKYPSIHLDGELYNHQLHDNFQELVSLIRKEVEPDIENKEKIQKYIKYYVYDMWDDNDEELTFDKRNKLLNDILQSCPNVEIVPTFTVKNGDEIDFYLKKFLEEGYEGLIIRTNDKYEHKRSSNLLKYKLFCDDEFQIIDIIEGNGNLSNVAGYCIVQLENNLTCKCNIKGNLAYKQNLLINKNQYIGKYATITYFERTNDGRLRFPYLKDIRDYE